MTEDQIARWRRAQAEQDARNRRQRYRPRTGLLSVRGAGMVRVLPEPRHATICQVSPNGHTCTLEDVSELPLEDVPGVADAAHEAARGEVVYITEHGHRLAAIVPAEYAEDLADAAAVRAARASIEAGEPLVPWEQVKAEAGL